MTFSHSKKNLHMLFLSFLILALSSSLASAAVDTSRGWHPVSQISTTPSSTTSIDNNANGVIDNTESCSGDTICEASSLYVSGNVGIGTASPGSPLHLYTTSDLTGGSFRIQKYTGLASKDFIIHVGSRADGSWPFTVDDSVVTLQASGSSGMHIAFASGNTERMRITIAGDVGIGTAVPSTKLDVAGFGTFDNQINLRDAGLGWAQLQSLSTPLYLKAGGGNNIILDTTGNVGIGTTDPSIGGRLNSKFTVITTPGGTGLAIGYGANSPAFALNPVSDGSWLMYDYTSGVWNQGIVQKGGNVGIGTTSPGQKLSVMDTFSVTNTAGIQTILIGNQDSAGVNNPATIRGANGALYFGGGTSWSGAGGAVTDNMVLTDAGNVGIGTTAPEGKLTVDNGNMFIRSGGILYLRPTANDYDWNIQATGYTLRIGSASFSNPINMVFTNNGNVGIGTASPTQKLTVNGEINYPSSWRLTNAWGNDVLTIKKNAWDGSSNNNYGDLAAGHGYFYNGLQSGGATGSEAGNEELYVGKTSILMGSVGIGTSSPQAKLDVVGNVIISGTIRGATYGFGGMYELGENNRYGEVPCPPGIDPSITTPCYCEAKNPITDACSCPAGFIAYATGSTAEDVGVWDSHVFCYK
jgi:hypothetical protein